MHRGVATTSSTSAAITATVLMLLASFVGVAHAQAPNVAFLAVETTEQDIAPHNRAAWETARGLADTTLLLASPDGWFKDTAGEPHNLTDFNVVWYHQGDSIARNTLYAGKHLVALKAFAQDGGALFLSGGALALVAQLGLETEIRPQRRQLENYRDPAPMLPVERTHPAFAGLQEENGMIALSRSGCPAVADFYWGGPAEGMLLANTPHSVERPLVEYALGKGRVIVFGWRWPDYADAENPYRANLLRLTENLLKYLASPQSWRPITIRSQFPPAVSTESPGIAESRWRALSMAIEDLADGFGDRYPRGQAFRSQLQALRAEHDAIPPDAPREAFASVSQRFSALQREALLANPLIDFERVLAIRRSAAHLGLPRNYQGNDDIPPAGYGNTLVSLPLPMPQGQVTTLFTPPDDRFIGDLDLHYDAEKLLLSMPDVRGRWGVAELELASGNLTPLPLIDEPDVHNYDACYLPDGRIIFTSTAPFIGVPCVGGQSKVANLYLLDHDGQIRRLTNDQDHNWCPTVLNDGRILYQRWEYADIAHTFTRLLFQMNPDGTGQAEYYGSNSFWPTAMFHARPIPGHPTEVVGVVGGHHDAPRQGELVIFDPARGRHEADGVVQRIPGYGKKVEPVILDGLIGASWPRFLHPFPLSDKYFLVSCKPTKDALWGLYLVDVFDNFVLIHEEAGYAILEPLPLRKTPRQPVVPDKLDRSTQEATVLLMNVYRGPGLAGVPAGSVKALRLVSYDFTFHGFGGEPDRVGMDGPWDVKRILGTVPVEPDGSAFFRVPACTPISLQPLDAEGKAVALMRSWLTAAPGEYLSCVGCHEKQNTTPSQDVAPTAVRRPPSTIKPWYGPARGFSFEREVQPVLNAYCIACHHGGTLSNGQTTFDLTARPVERMPSAFEMHFTPSYMELRRWVHTPTLESDAHLLPPRDFHADTSMLIQILRDGHYGLRLSDEAWDRLITWIDLNAPFHGAWRDVVAYDPGKSAAALRGAERRRALNRRCAGPDEDPEAIQPAAVLESPPVPSLPESPRPQPLDKTVPSTTTGAMQIERLDLADGISIELVPIEPGQFTFGSDDGYANEQPAHIETVEKPFLIGRCEITNGQYRCFAPNHDSGLETGEVYQFGDDERGFTLNRPEQPVVRVSWNDASAFCQWLSARTGRTFSLPTEEQWEYACRACTTTPLWYGTLDDDFSSSANLSDATHHTVYYPHVPDALPPWRPSDTRFDDHWRVSAPVGTFAPNPWGLCDMHGNVAEWTDSDYAPGQPVTESHKVVRGGSWMDEPRRARSAFRLHYAASQAIHDVGFRVVCEINPSK